MICSSAINRPLSVEPDRSTSRHSPCFLFIIFIFWAVCKVYLWPVFLHTYWFADMMASRVWCRSFTRKKNAHHVLKARHWSVFFVFSFADCQREICLEIGVLRRTMRDFGKSVAAFSPLPAWHLQQTNHPLQQNIAFAALLGTGHFFCAVKPSPRGAAGLLRYMTYKGKHS